MKHVLKPLAKSALTPLGLIVAVSALLTASAADVGIHKKFLDSGCFLGLVQ